MRSTRGWAAGLCLTVLAGSLMTLSACKGPPPVARNVDIAPTRDTPDALRGTIGSVTTARNIEPVIVSGYGLIVGLKGTGGGPLPDQIAVSMEREMLQRGISASNVYQKGTPLEGMTARQILRSPDVAVVEVYGVVPPGLAQGATFDVYVRSVSPTGASGPISLEGGQLWSTDLRIGPPSTFLQSQTTQIGMARGPVFINPFVEPGVKDDVTRGAGRILGGGVISTPLDVTLLLDNDSPALARAIQSSINSRFGGDQRDPDMIARGRSATASGAQRWVLGVKVPESFQDRTGDFLNLVRHSQIELGFADEYARRYVEALKSQPELGDELAWALQSLGEPAKPFIRELYDSPEIVPRWTALRAGAGLNDPRAIPAIQRLSENGPEALRPAAIRLLGKIDGGPEVDRTLRSLLEREELSVRVAAYEALAERAEYVEMRRRARAYASMSTVERASEDPPELQRSRIFRLSADSPQGVSRRVIADAFLLDRVAVGAPLIYVAQQGRPRLVLFGREARLRPGAFASGWSDRLMVKCPAETSGDGSKSGKAKAEVYYLDAHTGRGRRYEVDADLGKFIEFLAHRPSPEKPQQGLGLTYSEVVGALYFLQAQGAMEATLALESDELQARLLRAAEGEMSKARPETTKDIGKLEVFAPRRETTTERDLPGEKPSLVVPNDPAPTEKPSGTKKPPSE